jgi:hypothetical protein
LNNGGDLRKIVNLWRLRQAAQKRALERHGSYGFFVGLVGRKPQILAQGIVIAVYADLAGGAKKSAEAVFADEIRAVEMIVAYAHAQEHETIPRGGRG